MRTVLCVICLFLLVGAAFAQGDRGTLTGTVTDKSGGVIAGATVEAKSIGTGSLYPTTSTATGNWTLPQLPSGTYEVTVSMSGFKKFVREKVEVQVASTFRVDASLEVGAPSEMVTVTSETPLLKTESGELSHNVTTERVNNLPILTLEGAGGAGQPGNIRNPLQSTVLLPGATFAGDLQLRINGMPSSSQAIRIEGQDATNGMWRQITQINQSSVDAIQEVSIQTSNFAAEYGQAGGGYFNYTMRSGTNQLHGSAYSYIVNEALNAATPFTDTGSGNVKNAQRRFDYGFTLGGPLVIPHVLNGRDKLFFFFNFEQFREDQFVKNVIGTLPTAAYRAGDFSAAVFPFTPPPPDPLGRSFPANTIFDPRTKRTVNGQVVKDPFNNNTIPTALLDPVALKLQAGLPLPNLPGLLNNYSIPGYANNRYTTIPSFKLDYVVSPTIKLSGYFSQTHTTSPNNIGMPPEVMPRAPQADDSFTTRVNYDQSIKPTLLLHVGVGYLYTDRPLIVPTTDTSKLYAPNQQFYLPLLPSIGGLNNFLTGGFNAAGGFFGATLGTDSFGNFNTKDEKPTANASVTWVKGNHTLKTGAELVVEGIPSANGARANGVYTFNAQQTENPWEIGTTSFPFTTGFEYASFLLGASNGLQVGLPANIRLGNHTLGFFAQDTWKMTRKLTLDYGLRWDYSTLLQEQYGRMQNASLTTPNPVAGNRLGNVIYEANCNCTFNKNYKYAFGPRIGVAYQINSKTVLRVGTGISYGTSSNNAFLSASVSDFYGLAPRSPGDAATILQQGNPYAPGNVFGNAPLVWPDYSSHYPSEVAPGVRPPQAPFITIDEHAGRLPRIFQWSIGIQREIMPTLVVEAAYVGNRGVWWTAPQLAQSSYNALTPEGLKSQYGLDIVNSANDRTLMTLPINSPAVLARFPQFANPDKAVYPGFPASSSLIQALRPFPQWGNGGMPPFLGPPLGTTWYDSLQAKLTKRYAHGLDLQAAFTWQKELTLGANSDTSYFTPGTVLINDVYDRESNKQISALSRPFMFNVSFNYTTPKISESSSGMKVLSYVARDWTFGGVLRYQSGTVIRTPGSLNNLTTQLGRDGTNGVAVFGGGTTFWNRVSGQSPLAVDPNCHCFDPNTTLALNPSAWVDAAPGHWGTSAPYYNDVRWQRQPAESLSLGRNFRVMEKTTLQIRAEFQNIFNRVFLSAPSVGAPPFGQTPASAPTKAANGNFTNGYGYINTVGGAGTRPRSGQFIVRLNF